MSQPSLALIDFIFKLVSKVHFLIPHYPIAN